MRSLVFALALLGAAATVASAQDAIPDLKGTWTGKGKSIVFGNHPHHPGSQTPSDPPRVREHRIGEFGHLRGGRALHLHGHREPGDLGRCRRAGHDLVHRPGRLSGEQILLRRESPEYLGPGKRIVGCHVPIMTISRPGWSSTTTKRHTSSVTSAVGTSGTAITSRVHSLNRPNMVSVGTIVWLSSELMFFAGLFAMYFTARAQAAGDWAAAPPMPSAWIAVRATSTSTVKAAASLTARSASTLRSASTPARRRPWMKRL